MHSTQSKIGHLQLIPMNIHELPGYISVEEKRSFLNLHNKWDAQFSIFQGKFNHIIYENLSWVVSVKREIKKFSSELYSGQV